MKLKRRFGKIKSRIRKHRAASESKQVERLRLQRNKDIKEAKRLTLLAQARQEALEARMKKEKLKAPERKARAAKMAKAQKEASKALGGLMKAFGSMEKWANKKR